MLPCIPFLPVVFRELRRVLYIADRVRLPPHGWWIRWSEVQLHGLGGLFPQLIDGIHHVFLNDIVALLASYKLHWRALSVLNM